MLLRLKARTWFTFTCDPSFNRLIGHGWIAGKGKKATNQGLRIRNFYVK